MDCCDLSSTGLNDINANNITSDNITILSNLNVSGFSNLNELLVNDNATFSTSLNIGGFATLNNKTTLLSSLNVSGFTNLNNTTNKIGSLYISGYNVLQTLNLYGTSLSTLSNFRSDNANALVTLVNDTTIVHGINAASEIQFNTVAAIIDCLSKVDKDGNYVFIIR